MRAYRYYKNGLVKPNGNVYPNAPKLNAWDIAMTALSFQTTKVVEARLAEEAKRGLRIYRSDSMQDVNRKLAAALPIASKDKTLFPRMIQEIYERNKYVPESQRVTVMPKGLIQNAIDAYRRQTGEELNVPQALRDVYGEIDKTYGGEK
jgi:hypothetical protein